MKDVCRSNATDKQRQEHYGKILEGIMDKKIENAAHHIRAAYGELARSLQEYDRRTSEYIGVVQAEARNAALEEAARVCERRAHSGREGVKVGAQSCAQAIRALKEG